MKREDWVHMPHGAHFIGMSSCRFRLATFVGNYIVSTVGEYVPDLVVLEIFAKTRGIDLHGKGVERAADFLAQHGPVEIGFGRLYETMVFPARKATPEEAICGCDYRISDYAEVDMEGYNDAA